MFEKFTTRAMKVMSLAEEEALSLRSEWIDTGHLLVALAAEGSGIAAQVLTNQGLEVGALRSQLRKLTRKGAAAVRGKLPFAPRVREALETAREEADRFGHGQVGPEHLLLGFASAAGGTSAAMLRELRVSAEELRAKTLEMLGIRGEPPPKRRSAKAAGRVSKAAMASRGKVAEAPAASGRSLSSEAYVVPLDLSSVFDLLGLPKETAASQIELAVGDRLAALKVKAQALTSAPQERLKVEKRIEQLNKAWETATHPADAEETLAEETILSLQDAGLNIPKKPAVVNKLAAVLRAEGFVTEDRVFTDLEQDGTFDRIWAGPRTLSVGLVLSSEGIFQALIKPGASDPTAESPSLAEDSPEAGIRPFLKDPRGLDSPDAKGALSDFWKRKAETWKVGVEQVVVLLSVAEAWGRRALVSLETTAQAVGIRIRSGPLSFPLLVALKTLPLSAKLVSGTGKAWTRRSLVVQVEPKRVQVTVLGDDGERAAVLRSKGDDSLGCETFTEVLSSWAISKGARSGFGLREAVEKGWTRGEPIGAGELVLQRPEWEMELLNPVKRIVEFTMAIAGEKKMDVAWVVGKGAACDAMRRALAGKLGLKPGQCVEAGATAALGAARMAAPRQETLSIQGEKRDE